MDGGNLLPAFVSYKPDSNKVLTGEAARNLLFKNTRNTIYDAKRIIGKKANDKKLVELSKFWNFEMIEGRLGKPKIRVNVLGEDKILSPE